MSESSILWLFGTVIGIQILVIGAVVGAIWSHVRECKLVTAAIAEMSARLHRVEMDVGTHDSGMRGDIHSLREMVSPFVIRAQLEMQRERERR